MGKRAHYEAGECFQLGEVWETSRGMLYAVVGFEHPEGKPRQAVLRRGADGNGRKVLKDWDGVLAWRLHRHADGTLTGAASDY